MSEMARKVAGVAASRSQMIRVGVSGEDSLAKARAFVRCVADGVWLTAQKKQIRQRTEDNHSHQH